MGCRVGRMSISGSSPYLTGWIAPSVGLIDLNFRDQRADADHRRSAPAKSPGWGGLGLSVVSEFKITVSGTRSGIHYYPHPDQVRQAARLQLLDNVSAMQLDGTKADAEMTGDDLIGLAPGHQLEYLTFAGCQQGRADLQRGAFETLFIRPVIPMQRVLDAVEQGVLAQRLLNEVEGPGLHCSDRQRDSAMAGDEYHRDAP